MYDISELIQNDGVGSAVSESIMVSSVYHIADDFYLVYFTWSAEYFDSTLNGETQASGYSVIKCPNNNLTALNSEIYVWEYNISTSTLSQSRISHYINITPAVFTAEETN